MSHKETSQAGVEQGLNSRPPGCQPYVTQSTAASLAHWGLCLLVRRLFLPGSQGSWVVLRAWVSVSAMNCKLAAPSPLPYDACTCCSLIAEDTNQYGQDRWVRALPTCLPAKRCSEPCSLVAPRTAPVSATALAH